MRHIRKYHPEKDDVEQVILDMTGKTERDRCLNPKCNKLIVHTRLNEFPRYCNSKCQNEYYRLTGNHEDGLIRVPKSTYKDPCAIYIFLCKDLHLCKIGVSKHPDSRRGDIYKAVKKNLEPHYEVWDTVYQCHMWERELSKKYNEYRRPLSGLEYPRWAGVSEWYSDEIWEDLKLDLSHLKV